MKTELFIVTLLASAATNQRRLTKQPANQKTERRKKERKRAKRKANQPNK